jgi:hypothetical protein
VECGLDIGFIKKINLLFHYSNQILSNFAKKTTQDMSFETVEVIIGIVTICLMVATQGIYIIDVIRKKIVPSLLTWFGWALLMGVSLIAQIVESGWTYSQFGMITAALGCLAIGVTALILNNYSLKKIDWFILGAGLLCLVLYLVSKNAWLTTIYSILADLIIAIPMLIKVVNEPESEKTNAWYISFVTWALTLIISFKHDLLYAIFPIYLFVFCVVIIVLMNRKSEHIKA